MTNLDNILKSRDITLSTKVCLVKVMVFPVVMYGCESWTIKEAEQWRIDAFELWCWRRLLRVPWTERRSNQSILKEVSPECSLEGLMLKLKLQYLATWCKELTHVKTPWFWEGLRTGGEGDDRGWDGWMASPTWWTLVWVNSGSWWWTGRPIVLQSMVSQRVRQDWATKLNWTEYSIMYMYHNFFIHSSVDEYLGCFHVLAIVNSAAMNNGIHVSFSILVSSGYMPRNGIAGSYGGFITSF